MDVRYIFAMLIIIGLILINHSTFRAFVKRFELKRYAHNKDLWGFGISRTKNALWFSFYRWEMCIQKKRKS